MREKKRSVFVFKTILKVKSFFFCRMLSGSECLQMGRAECCTRHRKNEVDFPCLYPTNLHVCNLEDRLEKFFQSKNGREIRLKRVLLKSQKLDFFIRVKKTV